MVILDTIGRNLERLRKDRKLQQKEIAEMLGISQTAYSAWEKGKNAIPLEKLVTLAKYYQVSLDMICGFSSSSASKPFQSRADLAASIMNLRSAGAIITVEPESEKFSMRSKQAVICIPKIQWLNEFLDAWNKLEKLRDQGLLDETLMHTWLDAQLVKLNEEPLTLQEKD